MAVVLGLLLAFGLSVWWEIRAGSGGSGESTAAADTARSLEPPRVEVLNGAGEPGIAERTSERLRSRGFDVVFYGNAESFDVPTTRVIARSDRMRAVRRLAGVLAVDSVRREPRPDLFLDATVVLGDDWRQHLPPPAAADAGRDGGG